MVKWYKDRSGQFACAAKYGYKHPDELIKAEYRKGVTTREIGEMLELTHQAITTRTKKLGVYKPQGSGNMPYRNALKKRLTALMHERGHKSINKLVVAEYKKAGSATKAAKRLGVSLPFVTARIPGMGPKRRGDDVRT